MLPYLSLPHPIRWCDFHLCLGFGLPSFFGSFFLPQKNFSPPEGICVCINDGGILLIHVYSSKFQSLTFAFQSLMVDLAGESHHFPKQL
jgi:hypothetical protein